MKFSRPEYWNELPFPSLGDLPNPGVTPRFPALQADSLLSESRRKPKSEGCVGWESNPGQLLGKQLCSPLYHQCLNLISSVQFSRSVVSDSLRPPWTAAHQASLSITNSQSLLKLMSIELVMPSNHLILCQPLLLLPSIFPSIRVFSNESVLRIRWPKYWSFSFSISPSK